MVSVLPFPAPHSPCSLVEAQHQGPVVSQISCRAMVPQGSLFKRGARVGVSWNKRWVILTSSELAYSYGPVGGTIACARVPCARCWASVLGQSTACSAPSRDQCTV